MRAFLRLYLKELKSLYAIGMILFMISIGILVSGIFIIENAFVKYFRMGEPFYYCLMLFYSFYIERYSKSEFQLESIPLKRFYIICSKYLAVLSLALFIYISNIFLSFFTVSVAGFEVRKSVLINLLNLQGGSEYIFYLKKSVNFLFSNLFLMGLQAGLVETVFYLSAALIAQSLSEIVKKNKTVTLIGGFLTAISILPFAGRTRETFIMTHYFTINMILSLIFIALALILYEKYKEV